MRRRSKQAVALGCAAVAITLMWPGPTSAQTSLGGYSGVAQAQPVRIQIYEPTIPIPSSPQIDGSLGYTKSTVNTGPVSRALASYFWPGDTIGDGLDQLVPNPNAKYTVRSESRYPATPDAPAHNAMQITDGNGMTSSATQDKTTADVTGLGITGTNVLSDPFKGLQNLLPGAHKTPKTLALPLPVGNKLAGLISMTNLKSDSDITLSKNKITVTAHAAMSEIDLLGGLIHIDGFDVTSTTVSNGTKATTTGVSKIGDLSIAGQTIGLSDKGVTILGQHVKAPALPDVLADLGISIKYLQGSKSVDGATGSLSATALEVTVDTNPLKKLLGLASLTKPLAQLLAKVPKFGGELSALTQLGPKIVLRIGDVATSATAAPAWDGGGGSVAPNTPTTPVDNGSGADLGSGTLPVDVGTLPEPSTDTAAPPPDSGAQNPPAAQNVAPVNTALELPPLGSVPRMMILGALLLAGLVGWLLHWAAATLFGVGGSCEFGLAKGVPDLRKG